MSDLRQAAQEVLAAWNNPMGMKDLCVAMDAIRTALEQQAEPSQWRDMVVVSLVREGVNKHKARELADHFTAPPQQQAEPVGFEMAQPVAWRFKDPKDGHWLYTTHLVDLSKKYWRLKNELFDPLYTTPPQRQWVGLTDEDFLEACQIAERGNYLLALQRIQIKLKERNT